MNQSVLVATDDNITTITLHRPAQLNSFSTGLIEGLHEALTVIERSPAELVVFRASGKGFSGGLDLSDLDNESDADLLLRLVRIEQLLQRVRHAPYATAALVHGACYGAAADLVLACRTRIATPDARFLMPGMRFGIVLGTRRLHDTIGENNAYRLLDRTGPFKADEALASGFITCISETDEWPELLTQACRNVAQYSASAYAHRVNSLTPDTRAADMQALVTSVTDSSIQTRMLEYVASVKAEKASRSKR